MALIKCPECKKEISEMAKNCPNCGCPISEKELDETKQCKLCKEPYSRLENEKIAEGADGRPIYHQVAYCDNCKRKVDIECIKNQKAFESQKTNPHIVNQFANTSSLLCSKCGSRNILMQREQTASIGAGTNKVIIQQPKKSHGCLYWLIIGWWWKPFYWIFIGWWRELLFGGRRKSGLNFSANKSINKTMAVCQNCGHTWKV